MFYNCVSIVVEPHDREEVRKLLVRVLEKVSPYWASYFRRLRAGSSMFLLPGYEYLVLTRHVEGETSEEAWEKEPFLVIGKTDLGGFKLLYPVVVNWELVRRAVEEIGIYEDLQSAIFVGLGKVVLPIEGKKVVAIFDWGKSIGEAFPVLQEAIEVCFAYDLQLDLLRVFEFFEEGEDPVFLYLRSRLGDVGKSVLQQWRDVYFSSSEKDDIVVKWSFDGEVFVNAKMRTNEKDKKVLNVFKNKAM